MLNISCLKGDSDQTKFRFGISVKNCIGCNIFRKKPRNFIFHQKIYRKSGCCLSKIRKFWANSSHLRTRPRYWCDNAVWKIWGLWGHYFWSYLVNGRPDILTDFKVYSLFEYTKIISTHTFLGRNRNENCVFQTVIGLQNFQPSAKHRKRFNNRLEDRNEWFGCVPSPIDQLYDHSFSRVTVSTKKSRQLIRQIEHGLAIWFGV